MARRIARHPLRKRLRRARVRAIQHIHRLLRLFLLPLLLLPRRLVPRRAHGTRAPARGVEHAGARERKGRRGAAAAEVRPDVEAASDAEVQSRFEGTAWQACDSWYRDESGRIITNWPGYMIEYEKATERIDPDEYVWLAPGEQKVGS